MYLVTGYDATHECRDDQLCAVFKAGIYGAVHGVQSIWEANSTKEKLGFLLVDAKNVFHKIIESEYCERSSIYGCLEPVLFSTAIVTTPLLLL